MFDEQEQRKEGSNILLQETYDHTNDDNYFCGEKITSSSDDNSTMGCVKIFDGEKDKKDMHQSCLLGTGLGAMKVARVDKDEKGKIENCTWEWDKSKEDTVVQSILGEGYSKKLAEWYVELRRLRASDRSRLFGHSSGEFLAVFNTFKKLLNVLIKANNKKKSGKDVDKELKRVLPNLTSKLGCACAQYMKTHNNPKYADKRNRQAKLEVIEEIRKWTNSEQVDYLCRYNAMDELSGQLGIPEEERYWKKPELEYWSTDPKENENNVKKSVGYFCNKLGWMEEKEYGQRSERVFGCSRKSTRFNPLKNPLDYLVQGGPGNLKKDIGEMKFGYYQEVMDRKVIDGKRIPIKAKFNYFLKELEDQLTILDNYSFYHKTKLKDKYHLFKESLENASNKSEMIELLAYIISPIQCLIFNTEDMNIDKKVIGYGKEKKSFSEMTRDITKAEILVKHIYSLQIAITAGIIY